MNWHDPISGVTPAGLKLLRLVHVGWFPETKSANAAPKVIILLVDPGFSGTERASTEFWPNTSEDP